MSKQINRKAPNSANPRAAAGGSRPIKTTDAAPVKSGRTGRPVASGAAAGARTRASSGFKLKPLDLILLLLGVVVVGGVIWGGLNGAQPQQPVASVPDTQNQVAAAQTQAATQAQAGVNATVAAGSEALVPPGTPAPDFSLPATDGNTYTLSQFKGKKVVMLEFMAPWCPHCQADAPEFDKVYNQFKDKDVQLLGVSATPYGKDREADITMEDLTWFRDKFGVHYPLLLDKPLKSSDAYGIHFYPTVYLINKDGTVAEHMLTEENNPLDAARIIAGIEKILK